MMWVLFDTGDWSIRTRSRCEKHFTRLSSTPLEDLHHISAVADLLLALVVLPYFNIMADENLVELKEQFGDDLEPDVLAELQSIMRIHSIDVQELWFKWESYSMKMGSDDMNMGVESARALKEDIREGLEKENRKKDHLTSNKRAVAATPRAGGGRDVYGMLDGLVPNTPRFGSTVKSKRKFETPSARVKEEEIPSSPPTFTPYKAAEVNANPISFNDRQKAGQGVEILNEHLEAAEPPIAPYPEARIKLTAYSDAKKLFYKPMAMKSSEASEILDDRIDEYMALIQDHHKLEDSEFGSAVSQGINEIVAIGRIASDSLVGGKLNASSLVLETSRRMGAGLRVPLKLDALPGFQFFPGQIVALRGINTSGEEFAVSQILEAPILPGAASPPAALEGHIQRLRGDPNAMDTGSDPAPLNIICASGPYTSDDNLDFEALHALCSQAADTHADCLLLTGPFLDIDHPLIATGDFDLPDEAIEEPDTATMNTVFKYLISPAFIQLVAQNPNITIILIPSVKDAISKHVSWPQEPFPRKDLGLPKTVKIVGNPITLALNELAVGVSSQDILTELRISEVIGGRPKDASLLARLPKYLIEQRNFFPLFPPVDREALPKTGTASGIPAGAMLDVSYLKLGEMINIRPDILIVPSSLPPFANVCTYYLLHSYQS